jgi:hypothetical protein
MNGETCDHLCLGLVAERARTGFSVYLINDTPIAYRSVLLHTRATVSLDGQTLDSRPLARNLGHVLPYAALLVERSHRWDLDAVLWYEFTLAPLHPVLRPERRWARLNARTMPEAPTVILPIVRRAGWAVGLAPVTREP